MSERKVVVVTGGARGQGAAHSRTLAEDGFLVYALDLRDDLGAELEAEARSAGLDIRYRRHDVTDETAWTGFADELQRAHGGVDALINNAGIVHTAPIEDEELARFELTLRVNVTGVFLGTRALWSLLAARRGVVVNTSSVYGQVSAPGYVAYTASKAAVLGITKTAALEGARFGIRVNALLPGTVQTQQLEDEGKSYVRQSTPLDRGASPEELAKVVRFLVSPDSGFISGTEIIVDGGFSAGGFSVGRD